jgi:hypothetical protein
VKGHLLAVRREFAAELEAKRLVGSSGVDELTLDCGVLRSCIWALTRNATSVHINRLLNVATASQIGVGAHATVDARARLRESLDVLAEVGDVVELANGWWVPAGVREVLLANETDDRLIVGGVPTSVLPSEHRALLLHRGQFRTTRGDALASAFGLAIEPLDSWVGRTPTDLESWGRQMLAASVDPYTEPSEGVRFRFYVPRRSGEPQGFRWRDSTKGLDGRYFAFRELPFGLRQPRIVEVKRDSVCATRPLGLAPGDARRLQYAVDAVSRMPVTVSIKRASTFQVTLRSEIPRSEQRLFAALGELRFPDDRYYPRTWTFPNEHADQVSQRLAALRVELRHENA